MQDFLLNRRLDLALAYMPDITFAGKITTTENVKGRTANEEARLRTKRNNSATNVFSYLPAESRCLNSILMVDRFFRASGT